MVVRLRYSSVFQVVETRRHSLRLFSTIQVSIDSRAYNSLPSTGHGCQFHILLISLATYQHLSFPRPSLLVPVAV